MFSGLLFIASAATAAVGPSLDRTDPRLQDYYPLAAIMGNEHGIVAVTLTIAADGTATGCVITKSSGFADLDRAACEIFTKHVHYKPGRDTNGNAVKAEFSTQFNFELR